MIGLSIIVPVFNAEDSIRECVESLIREAPEDSEIILVDDGSTDNSGMICDYYKNIDDRVFIIHKKNEGVSKARNTGLDFANGEKVFFLDSDDYLPAGYFKSMLKDVDLTISNYYAFYPDQSSITGSFFSKEYLTRTDFLKDFNIYFATIFNFPWGKVFRRDIIEQYAIRFRPDIHVSEDVIFNVEYYQCCNTISIIDDVMVMYRQSLVSLSHTYNHQLFKWYETSYKIIRDCLIDNQAFTDKNRAHYYTQFFADTIECLLGAQKDCKETLDDQILQVFNSNLLKDAIPYLRINRYYFIILGLKAHNLMCLRAFTRINLNFLSIVRCVKRRIIP